jgi:hypothetical protein
MLVCSDRQPRDVGWAIAHRFPFKCASWFLQAHRNISATLDNRGEFSILSFIDSPCEN